MLGPVVQHVTALASRGGRTAEARTVGGSSLLVAMALGGGDHGRASWRWTASLPGCVEGQAAKLRFLAFGVTVVGLLATVGTATP